ncbi:MAG: hypothetical protein U0T81_01835 [Saprospiraceae bacterium]
MPFVATIAPFDSDDKTCVVETGDQVFDASPMVLEAINSAVAPSAKVMWFLPIFFANGYNNFLLPIIVPIPSEK